MTFDNTITDVINRLRQGKFPNEQAISQGIVLRFLQDLGWNTWDTSTVWPEYQTGEGRVDFALCHPAEKAAIFIEVKQPGKAEEGVRQALEYAFHTGVPFVVLTDGRTWSFHPMMTCGNQRSPLPEDLPDTLLPVHAVHKVRAESVPVHSCPSQPSKLSDFGPRIFLPKHPDPLPLIANQKSDFGLRTFVLPNQ